MIGSCRCGNIGFAWTCAKPVGAMQPRACQCSFCKPYAAAYLSAPDSSLRFWIRDETRVEIKKCGSETAAFYTCANCAELVLVTCAVEGRLYAVINGNTLRDKSFKAPVPIHFSADETAAEKLARRQKTWISTVSQGAAPAAA